MPMKNKAVLTNKKCDIGISAINNNNYAFHLLIFAHFYSTISFSVSIFKLAGPCVSMAFSPGEGRDGALIAITIHPTIAAKIEC
jgi:hypothetical protein